MVCNVILIFYCLEETQLKYKDKGMRVKEYKKISQVNTNQKKAEVAILDNIDF